MPASSSRSIIRFLEETTPGTIETGGPKIYRVTGGTLNQSVEYAEDKELRADRGRSPSILVSGAVNGAFDVYYSHKTHDEFLQALFANDYDEVDTNGIKTVADMAFTASTHTISGSATLPLLEKGQWFQITGANTAGNNGIYKASSSTAPTTSAIVVDTAVKDISADDTAHSTYISSARLKQGNDDLKTFTIERELEDVTKFFTWKGCYVSGLTLNYTIGSQVTGNISFLGIESEVQGTASLFTGIGSEVAATTTESFNSVTGTKVLVDGAEMGDSCTESFSLEINSGLREQRCIGAGLTASGVAADQFTVTGKLNVFFGSTASATLYQKKLTDTAMSFAIGITDSAGNGMAITIPAAKITEATVDGGAMGSDVMMSISFSAHTDSTLASMVALDRLGSVA